MAENPTPEEMVKIAQSGNTGAVKTLSDLRYDKLAAELAELKTSMTALIKQNEELRAANAELYSFAAQVSQPNAAAPMAAPVPAASPEPVAAAPIASQAAAEQKAREDVMLNNVLQQMGYRRPEPSQSANDTPQDGM